MYLYPFTFPVLLKLPVQVDACLSDHPSFPRIPASHASQPGLGAAPLLEPQPCEELWRSTQVVNWVVSFLHVFLFFFL